MKLRDLARWNMGVSLIYAVGIWTVIGTAGYVRMKRNPDSQTVKEQPSMTIASESSIEENQQKGSRFKTTITYKENFVPYSTRLYNFVQSFLSTSNTHGRSNTSEK
ncbi:small integral membrane protein 26 [Protopterus annectens]|uniref:small integral membrane protein 26 n=1 Tax=Protopterus annectens TaxID=7888 RepID=UPI001CFC0D2D|nr:small integral membrane protein 26 [Protopterus annectens]